MAVEPVLDLVPSRTTILLCWIGLVSRIVTVEIFLVPNIVRKRDVHMMTD